MRANGFDIDGFNKLEDVTINIIIFSMRGRLHVCTIAHV